MKPEPSFHIRTYGCQMNVHDSDKLANLLHHSGFHRALAAEEADLLVVNTCSIRDKAENQLYSDLGKLRSWKDRRPGRLLGVGGCVAQQVGDSLLRRFSHLDFVFGTHNLRMVPAMVAAAGEGRRRAETDESRSLDRFELPPIHERFESDTPGRAFLTVMEGCDMFCSFCIVPRTRGREISRPAQAILDDARTLAERGVREITLLGQTVNAYGRHDTGRGTRQQSGTMAFAELLEALDVQEGIDRIRYTSPHPVFFDTALIDAHANLESLCPHVHLPAQSGSDSVLEVMRRRYDRAQYLSIVASLRDAVPDVAITTDLIVGFPGETDRDFRATLELMQEAEFVDSYSFKYSARPGTAAADRPGQVDPEEAQERLEQLQDAQRSLTLDHHRSRVGGRAEVLIEGPSRRGGDQICGRDRHHRLVNLVADERDRAGALQPGQSVEVDVVEATPHSLIGRPVGALETGVRGDPRGAGSPRASAESSQEANGSAGSLPEGVIHGPLEGRLG
ncbi:MAG: tRNA (N6-isopentenyl adenosine(37)-C2)-methylthiotransferase MiaB [Myxococcota bacterium]